MQKLIIVIFICFVAIFTNKANAQTAPPNDTLIHLQNIVNNKSFYIGKPFSVLMDSLQYQIKFFSPFGGIHHDKNKETSTSFSFYFPQSATDHYLSYPRLEITWQPYLNASQSNLLWNNNNYGGWNTTVKSYYSSGMVADIKVIN